MDSAVAILTYDNYWAKFSELCGAIKNEKRIFREKYWAWAERNSEPLKASSIVAITSMEDKDSFESYSNWIEKKNDMELTKDYKRNGNRIHSLCNEIKEDGFPARMDIQRALPLQYEQVLNALRER